MRAEISKTRTDGFSKLTFQVYDGDCWSVGNEVKMCYFDDKEAVDPTFLTWLITDASAMVAFQSMFKEATNVEMNCSQETIGKKRVLKCIVYL